MPDPRDRLMELLFETKEDIPNGVYVRLCNGVRDLKYAPRPIREEIYYRRMYHRARALTMLYAMLMAAEIYDRFNYILFQLGMLYLDSIEVKYPYHFTLRSCRNWLDLGLSVITGITVSNVTSRTSEQWYINTFITFITGSVWDAGMDLLDTNLTFLDKIIRRPY